MQIVTNCSVAVKIQQESQMLSTKVRVNCLTWRNTNERHQPANTFLQQKQLQQERQASQKYPRKEAVSLTWSGRQRRWHQIVMSPSKMYSKSNLTILELGIMNVWANNELLFMEIALCLHSAVLVRGPCAICSLKDLPASDVRCRGCFLHVKFAVQFLIFVFPLPHRESLFLLPAAPRCVGLLIN